MTTTASILFVIPAAACPALAVLLCYARVFFWFGRLPDDIRMYHSDFELLPHRLP